MYQYEHSKQLPNSEQSAIAESLIFWNTQLPVIIKEKTKLSGSHSIVAMLILQTLYRAEVSKQGEFINNNYWQTRSIREWVKVFFPVLSTTLFINITKELTANEFIYIEKLHIKERSAKKSYRINLPLISQLRTKLTEENKGA